MKRILTAILLLLIAQEARAAGGTYSGLYKPYIYANVLFITATGTPTVTGTVPACATRPILELQWADTDPLWQAEFAILLSSYLAGKTVTIIGTGTCSNQGDELVQMVSPN